MPRAALILVLTLLLGCSAHPDQEHVDVLFEQISTDVQNKKRGDELEGYSGDEWTLRFWAGYHSDEQRVFDEFLQQHTDLSPATRYTVESMRDAAAELMDVHNSAIDDGRFQFTPEEKSRCNQLNETIQNGIAELGAIAGT